MSLRPNLARLLASLRRSCEDIARRRSRYRPRGRCFHPSPVKHSCGEYSNEWTNCDLASTTVSRNPRAQIYEPQSVRPIEDEREKEMEQKGGFLIDAREMILVLARIAIVISVITTLLAAYLITRLTHASSFPIILRKGIEFLGPIFVKFGQWISTRRDVFPRDICDTLSQLQRNATPHSWLYTERLLETTYGPYWRNLFVRFDDKGPIGSGCCAQVDLRLEACNLVRFSANFSRRNDIVFPYPYTHLTCRKILVESFHEGSPISDYLEHDDAALQRKLARIGIATILKMIFKDNFIHCDLHPGNILVEKVVVPQAGLFSIFRRVITPDYVAYDPRLIILDCGLVVSLNDRCRQNLRDVFYSVLMGNGEMAAQYILEHSSHMTPDPDGFKCSMKNIVKSHLCHPFNVNVSTVVSELFSAMVRHQVKQDGSFSSVILSMLVIEGLGRCLDPDIDIFTEILPYVLNTTI